MELFKVDLDGNGSLSEFEVRVLPAGSYPGGMEVGATLQAVYEPGTEPAYAKFEFVDKDGRISIVERSGDGWDANLGEVCEEERVFWTTSRTEAERVLKAYKLGRSL